MLSASPLNRATVHESGLVATLQPVHQYVPSAGPVERRAGSGPRSSDGVLRSCVQLVMFMWFYVLRLTGHASSRI